MTKNVEKLTATEKKCRKRVLEPIINELATLKFKSVDNRLPDGTYSQYIRDYKTTLPWLDSVYLKTAVNRRFQNMKKEVEKEEAEKAKAQTAAVEAQAEAGVESSSDTVRVYEVISPNVAMMPTIIPLLNPSTTSVEAASVPTTTTTTTPTAEMTIPPQEQEEVLLDTFPQQHQASQGYIELARNEITLKYHEAVTEFEKKNTRVPRFTYQRIVEEVRTKRGLPPSFNFGVRAVRRRLKSGNFVNGVYKDKRCI